MDSLICNAYCENLYAVRFYQSVERTKRTDAAAARYIP